MIALELLLVGGILLLVGLWSVEWMSRPTKSTLRKEASQRLWKGVTLNAPLTVRACLIADRALLTAEQIREAEVWLAAKEP